MQIAIVTFSVSLIGMVLLIGLKMTVFKERHIFLWVSIRKNTDVAIHRTGNWIGGRFVAVKNQGLLKIVSVVYHSLIPFVDKQYRKIASLLYRVHRRFSSALEYSKSSTKNVSEYLKHLSDHAKKESESVSEPETVEEEKK